MNWRRGLSWIYPPRCVRCEAPTESVQALLCSECVTDLFLIPTHTRCTSCFAHKGDACAKQHIEHVGVAAAFDSEGPGSALAAQITAFSDERYTMLLASFLYVQKEQMRWPEPGRVIAMPRDHPSRFLQKNRKARDLARAFAKLSGVQKNGTGDLYIISDRIPRKAALAKVVKREMLKNPSRVFSLNLLTR